MRNAITHDPCPDHRTGPWLRKCHEKNETGTLIYDARCPRCVAIADRSGTRIGPVVGPRA